VARIEGTGIKTPSSGSQKMAKVYYGGPEAEKRRQLKKDLDKFMKDFGGSPASDKFNPKGTGMGDRFDPTASRPNYFSPGGGAFDSRNNVQVASAEGIQSLSLPGSPEFKQEVKQYEQSIRDSDIPGHIDKFGTDELKNLTEQGQKNLEESYKIYRDFNYERNPIQYRQGTDFSKKEEKPSLLERTRNLAGSIFNTVTGTQPVAASQIPGGMPTGTQFTSSNLDATRAPTGDTSFASYRMAGQPSRGEQQQQQGSGIVTPFSQTSMGKGEARKVTPFSETSMGQRVSAAPTTTPKTVTINGQTVAARQTVASLPSNYKQTEAEAFRKAAAFKEAQGIAKRNPNVSVGVDSKGQPKATATNDTARARAQAAAVNRKISGKSISQTKADNRAAVRKSAAERQAAFKKTGKSTVGARRAAAKAKVKAAAKKRHSAFKKRRKNKKKKCDIFLKYNIAPLTNMNLVRDDLAEVAYFVKEIQEK